MIELRWLIASAVLLSVAWVLANEPAPKPKTSPTALPPRTAPAPPPEPAFTERWLSSAAPAMLAAEITRRAMLQEPEEEQTPPVEEEQVQVAQATPVDLKQLAEPRPRRAKTGTDICQRHRMHKQFYRKNGWQYWRCRR